MARLNSIHNPKSPRYIRDSILKKLKEGDYYIGIQSLIEKWNKTNLLLKYSLIINTSYLGPLERLSISLQVNYNGIDYIVKTIHKEFNASWGCSILDWLDTDECACFTRYDLKEFLDSAIEEEIYIEDGISIKFPDIEVKMATEEGTNKVDVWQ